MMVNDCIRIGLSENITSMKKLSLACYHRLGAYNSPSQYRLTAISKAAGILRNYRKGRTKNPKAKKPYAERLFLVECYRFRIFGRLLRLPYRKDEYIFIVLNDHTLKALSNHIAKSITLTPDMLSICYSKEMTPIPLEGLIGIDSNLDNVTLANSNGAIHRYDLSRATMVRAMSRETKRHFTRNDARIRREVFSKYGKLQRNRVSQLLHRVSKRIIDEAKKNKFGIVMEDLTGLRKLYRKGNGQGKNYRALLNSWYYRELQRQIEYKARWEGLPVK
jgi:putative transposase